MESLPRMPKPTVFNQNEGGKIFASPGVFALIGDIFEDPNWNDVTGI